MMMVRVVGLAGEEENEIIGALERVDLIKEAESSRHDNNQTIDEKLELSLDQT